MLGLDFAVIDGDIVDFIDMSSAQRVDVRKELKIINQNLIRCVLQGLDAGSILHNSNDDDCQQEGITNVVQ